MRYVDGFLMAVQTKNLKAYRALALKAEKIWREHGALQYVEAAADDVNVQFGIPFTKTIKLKPGETIVFSFIVFKSRAHRDSVNKKVMNDPRLAKMIGNKPPPFDMKRMAYGGFKMVVDA